MMIFLAVLKIIGIVLCVIIGIIAVILFVPFCYEVDADIDKKEFKARIYWLRPLLRFEFYWKEKVHAVFKILWFVIDFTDPEAVAARREKKEAKARKKLQKQQKKNEKRCENIQKLNRKKKSDDIEERARQRAEFHRQQVEIDDDKAEYFDHLKSLDDKTKAEQHQNDTTISNRQNMYQENHSSEEVNEKKQTILDKLKAIHGKAGLINEKIKRGISIIQFLREQELIPIIWVKLKVFLLHIRPRTLRGNLKFGLSNPADTGQILGGIAIIPFLYQTELQIEPDFEAEDNYIQGQVYSRGHMCCIHLVILIIRLLRDKKIRNMIHAIRENK